MLCDTELNRLPLLLPIEHLCLLKHLSLLVAAPLKGDICKESPQIPEYHTFFANVYACLKKLCAARR